MTRPAAELDIENLVDFFQIKMRDRATGVIYNFPLYPGSPPLDRDGLCKLLQHYTIYTFNGINYDLPILTLALYGAPLEALKPAGDQIIQGGMKHWEFYKYYGIVVPDFIDHVDLFDVAPGVSIGLKMYMGRIHAPRMQDLPIEHDQPVMPAARLMISTYCDNDLEGTGLLRELLKDRIELRARMSQQYGVELRSKSDAQIAEAVIKAKLGFDPERRYIPHGYTFNYQPPSYLRYATPQLQEVLQVVSNAPFLVSDKEEAIMLGDFENLRTGVQIPAALKGRNIHIGQSVYRMGIGGLHSQEESQWFAANDEFEIIDFDVKSYYPSLILTMGMVPQQLGERFIDIYREVYHTRLQAKAAADKLEDLGLLSEAVGDKTIADGLKIVLNGTFGKLFSKYSVLYAPELGIRVTMSGQLALLMLIEMMELSGIRVISANTDGIVLLVPRKLRWIAESNVAWWERTTGLQMEDTHYRAIYSRDVNNYIAITTKGKVKRKGVFAPSGLLSGPQGKHPDKDICADAVVAYLKDGVPIEQTIRECRDIRKFLQIRTVKGGAVDLPAGVAINDGRYLGKAVRWYISGRAGYIGYKGTGAKVAGSEGATPIMDLPEHFPANVQYEYYIQHANDMLSDLGVSK